MIVDSGKFYLYRHIRLDTNQPFYIGIGTKGEDDWKYRYYTRALSNKNRNNHWIRIVKKFGFKYEILLESNDYEFIKEKEKEFIKLYGRRDLGLGTLVNMTDGGEGCQGLKHTNETKKKLSIANKGKDYISGIKRSEETKMKISIAKTGKKQSRKAVEARAMAILKPILQYSLNGEFIKEWKSIKEAADTLNIHHSNICAALYKKYKQSGGFKWEFKTKKDIK